MGCAMFIIFRSLDVGPLERLWKFVVSVRVHRVSQRGKGAGARSSTPEASTSYAYFSEAPEVILILLNRCLLPVSRVPTVHDAPFARPGVCQGPTPYMLPANGMRDIVISTGI